MYRESMPDIDFADALSSAKQKSSDFASTKRKEFSDWAGLRRKKYVAKNTFSKYYKYAKSNLALYGKAYGKFFAFEFMPYVVAYGLMINFPVTALLGWALTVVTVLSWGLVFYLIDEEVTSIFNEMKPYIRVSVKVDN